MEMKVTTLERVKMVLERQLLKKRCEPTTKQKDPILDNKICIDKCASIESTG